MLCKRIKWYHWLWIWMLPTKVAIDKDKRGSKTQTTTVLYKSFMGTMYVIGTKYDFNKGTKRTRSQR